MENGVSSFTKQNSHTVWGLFEQEQETLSYGYCDYHTFHLIMGNMGIQESCSVIKTGLERVGIVLNTMVYDRMNGSEEISPSFLIEEEESLKETE